MAKLIFKYATMNSGKSMDLIRTVYNYKENDCNILVMKPMIDTKGGASIETRAGLSIGVDILIPKDESILRLLSGRLDGVECIFIDEAQFLSAKQVNDLFVVAKVLDIHVICYGLRTNFKSVSFEGSSRLLELADSLEEFKTLCHCHQIARFCGRKVNGEYVTRGDDVVIDGTSNIEYVPLCGDCYTKEVLHIDGEKVKKYVKVM